MSQALGRGKSRYVARSLFVFFFSGREAMLIYMRGHPAQQITERLVDFIFPTR
jgi:hypothetical protein